MNATQLLAHFDSLAEAPDAVPRLRRFILDLAVRGKLVEQDAGDEPAAELLKRIRTEKEQLIKAGFAKNVNDLTTVNFQEQPFPLPTSWSWVRLVNVLTKLTDGTHFSPSNAPSGDFKYITAKNIKPQGVSLDNVTYVTAEAHAEIFARCDPQKGDILYIKDGATTGVVTVNNLEEQFSMLSSVALLKVPNGLFNRLLVEFLRSPFFFEQMRGFMKGAAIPRVTLKRMGPALLPFPPLAEQHRIVAKVDELMALCDKLEAAQQERERRRDRLAAASLQGLNQLAADATPEAQREHARFHLHHLPRLTTQPEHIKAMRQLFLDLAVRGKLLAQDSNDEPAGELLRKIQREKPKHQSNRKKEITLSDVDLSSVPFELPSGWAWARFPELGVFGRGKSKHRPRNDPSLFDGGTHLLVQTGDVARSKGAIKTFTGKYNDVGLAQSMKWPSGTLCITIAANIADSGILSFDACFPDSVVGFKASHLFDSARYFEYFVRTAKADLLKFAPATAQKNINLEILNAVLIPLPPLAEQHRIVAKVDELMTLCDQLEAQLITTQTDSRRLLDALIAA